MSVGKGDYVTDTGREELLADAATLKGSLVQRLPFDVAQWEYAFAEFAAMRKCPQDPLWHAEGDVLTHTQMALERLWENISSKDERWEALTLAVLLHDVGKPAVSKRNPQNGRIVAYDHEQAGVPIAREFLRNLGYQGQQRDPLLQLIAWHMRPRELSESETKDLAFTRLALAVPIPDLLEVLRADRLGRKAQDVTSDWENTQLRFHARLEKLQLLGTPFFDFTPQELDTIGVAPERREYALGRMRYEVWQGWCRSRESCRSRLYELRDEEIRGKLYLLAGAPGAGKSTWAEQSGAHIISTDTIRLREKLYPLSKLDTARVHTYAHIALKEQLSEGSALIAYDATNIDERRRVQITTLARNYNYEIVGVSFDQEPEQAQKRNKQRKSELPPEIVRRYLEQLTPFSSYEVDSVRYPAEE